jgi:hypothetical protein
MLRIRVGLYNGKIVEAEITAITNRSTGRKVQFVYDDVTTSINSARITEVLQWRLRLFTASHPCGRSFL